MSRPRRGPLIWLLILSVVGLSLSACTGRNRQGKTPGPGPQALDSIRRPDRLPEPIPVFSFDNQPVFSADAEWLKSGKSQTGAAEFWPKQQTGGYHVRPFGSTWGGGVFSLSGPDAAGWKAEILLTDKDYRKRGTPIGVLSPQHPSWAAELPGNMALVIKSWAAPGTSPPLTLKWNVAGKAGVNAVRVLEGTAEEGLPAIEYVLAQSGIAGREMYYSFGDPIWVLDSSGGYTLQVVKAGTLSSGKWTLSADGPQNGWVIQVVMMDQPQHPIGSISPGSPSVEIEVSSLSSILLKVQGQPGADLSKLAVMAQPKQ